MITDPLNKLTNYQSLINVHNASYVYFKDLCPCNNYQVLKINLDGTKFCRCLGHDENQDQERENIDTKISSPDHKLNDRKIWHKLIPELNAVVLTEYKRLGGEVEDQSVSTSVGIGAPTNSISDNNANGKSQDTDNENKNKSKNTNVANIQDDVDIDENPSSEAGG